MPAFDNPELNLMEMIEGSIKNTVLNIHTALPGIMVKYDPDTQRADVQIAIKRKVQSTGKTIPVGLLKDLPVVFPRSGKVKFHFPLEKGDSVLLLFSERNLEPWLDSDGASILEPADVARFHDLNDAVVFPGLYPDSKPMVFDSDPEKLGFTIATEKLKLSLTEDGKIFFARAGEAPAEAVPLGNVLATGLGEILDAIKQLATDLKTGPVGVGNMGAPVPTHPSLITAIESFSATLDQIKSTYLEDAGTNILSQVTFTERGA